MKYKMSEESRKKLLDLFDRKMLVVNRFGTIACVEIIPVNIHQEEGIVRENRRKLLAECEFFEMN